MPCMNRTARSLKGSPLVSFALAATLAVAACGGSDDNGGSGFADGGTGGGSTAGGTTAGTGTGGGFGDDDSGGATGGGGQTCAATSIKADKAQVDIIFFVDTSGSMDNEIVQIKANINTFASTIGTSGLDYQVLMIAEKGTGKFQICVPAPLGGANCGDSAPKFHAIDQTIASTDGLAKIISTYDTWKSYLRPTAYKAFVAITDDNAKLAAATFDTQLLAKLPAGMFGTAASRRYIMNSICGWSDGTPVLSTTKCSTAVNIGENYQKLSQLTGGTVDSVCKSSFDTVFANIAKGLVTKLGCELTVPTSSGDAGVTDPSKVVVQYTPGSGAAQRLAQVTDVSKCAQFPEGWYYDNNASPTKIELCAGKCATVSADSAGKIEVLVGCKGDAPH